MGRHLHVVAVPVHLKKKKKEIEEAATSENIRQMVAYAVV